MEPFLFGIFKMPRSVINSSNDDVQAWRRGLFFVRFLLPLDRRIDKNSERALATAGSILNEQWKLCQLKWMKTKFEKLQEQGTNVPEQLSRSDIFETQVLDKCIPLQFLRNISRSLRLRINDWHRIFFFWNTCYSGHFQVEVKLRKINHSESRSLVLQCWTLISRNWLNATNKRE